VSLETWPGRGSGPGWGRRWSRSQTPAGLASAYFLFSKIFFSTFFGSGPVVHSGGEGRTGGGGPGGSGVQGGFGIFMPRFLSLGACCRRLLPMATSFSAGPMGSIPPYGMEPEIGSVWAPPPHDHPGPTHH